MFRITRSERDSKSLAGGGVCPAHARIDSFPGANHFSGDALFDQEWEERFTVAARHPRMPIDGWGGNIA
jgi:hypothetical protein